MISRSSDAGIAAFAFVPSSEQQQATEVTPSVRPTEPPGTPSARPTALSGKPSARPTELPGRWEGMLSCPKLCGSPPRYPMAVSLTSDKRGTVVGSSTYVEQDCKKSLYLTAVVESEMRLTESLVGDANDCWPQDLHFTAAILPDGKLAVRYYLEGNFSAKPYADAVLSRVA